MMNSFSMIPIEIAEKFTKGLDCRTLQELQHHMPAAQWHYNIKCKPSNFRKDLNHYFSNMPTYSTFVLNKISNCFVGKVEFVSFFLNDVNSVWMDEELKKKCIYNFTSETANELAQGRVNMKTIDLLDFIRLTYIKDENEENIPEDPIINVSEQIENIWGLATTKYIGMENVDRYYYGQIVAFASKSEPTVLRLIKHSDGYHYDQDQGTLALDKKFIVYPHEEPANLYRRFANWLAEAADQFPAASEEADEYHYDSFFSYHSEVYDSDSEGDNDDLPTRENYLDEDVVIHVFIAEVIDVSTIKNIKNIEIVEGIDNMDELEEIMRNGKDLEIAFIRGKYYKEDKIVVV